VRVFVTPAGGGGSGPLVDRRGQLPQLPVDPIDPRNDATAIHQVARERLPSPEQDDRASTMSAVENSLIFANSGSNNVDRVGGNCLASRHSKWQKRHQVVGI
jgi:hypothetical protein